MKEGYPQHSRTESKTQNAREIVIRIDFLNKPPPSHLELTSVQY